MELGRERHNVSQLQKQLNMQIEAHQELISNLKTVRCDIVEDLTNESGMLMTILRSGDSIQEKWVISTCWHPRRMSANSMQDQANFRYCEFCKELWRSSPTSVCCCSREYLWRVRTQSSTASCHNDLTIVNQDGKNTQSDRKQSRILARVSATAFCGTASQSRSTTP